MATVFLVIIISYILGSFPTSVVVGKALRGVDIRQYGSGNAGATNAFRVLGAVPAVFILGIDFAKGMTAVVFVSKLSEPAFGTRMIQIIAGLAAIIGHVWSLFVGFKGGKGVGTAAGVLAILAPFELGIAVLVWVAMTFTTGYVSLGSMAAAVTFPTVMGLEKFGFGKSIPDELLAFACLIGFFIILTHRSNIKRLVKGRENRFRRIIR